MASWCRVIVGHPTRRGGIGHWLQGRVIATGRISQWVNPLNGAPELFEEWVTEAEWDVLTNPDLTEAAREALLRVIRYHDEFGHQEKPEW